MKKHHIPYVSLICGIILMALIIGVFIFLKRDELQQTIRIVTCQERVNKLFYCQ